MKPVALSASEIPNYSALASLTLNAINDGVMLIDEAGIIKFANPAAATMLGYGSPTNVIGLSYQAVLRFETTDGQPVNPETSKLTQAIQTGQQFDTREYVLISAQSERKAAISLTMIPTGGPRSNKIITFRDITKELEKEEDQNEFISTASHEMRTPVASIEGYLGLALNPQTATIDDRAKQYLEAAHKASQHLGHLFKDLLDVTKLDDGRLKLHLVPVEIVSTVREMVGAREKDMAAKHLKYSFGTNAPVNGKQIEQLVYAAVDLGMLREILDNLIENAIKYTPEGGEIWVNARGDGDKVLINVTDNGIGISPDDAAHIFQKFYRVDNSQTRQIGGTGLGLYLVKQRVEAMDGRVWVESAFGDGSTFFVSLPRLSNAEYQKRLLAYQNEQTVQAFSETQSGAKPQVTTSSVSVPLRGAEAGTATVVQSVEQTSAPQVMPAASAVQATGQTMQVQTAPVVPQQPQPVVQMPAQAQTQVVPQAQQVQPQVMPVQQAPVQPQVMPVQQAPVQPVTGPNDLTIPRNDQLNNQKGVA